MLVIRWCEIPISHPSMRESLPAIHRKEFRPEWVRDGNLEIAPTLSCWVSGSPRRREGPAQRHVGRRILPIERARDLDEAERLGGLEQQREQVGEAFDPISHRRR